MRQVHVAFALSATVLPACTEARKEVAQANARVRCRSGCHSCGHGSSSVDRSLLSPRWYCDSVSCRHPEASMGRPAH